jgi:2-polyprenyl-6-methoxyphenol hydroxylase-like FAD-dependent oxidoreductase
VDIAIIGGGMTGMLTAYELTRRGLDAVVLEPSASEAVKQAAPPPRSRRSTATSTPG